MANRAAARVLQMVASRVLQIVRQFWENAIKLLLEDPKNVRDL